MKRLINIYEVDKIIVTAPTADVVATMIWRNIQNGNDSNEIVFRAEYHYDGLDDGYKYCEYCGNVYKPSVNPTADECDCEKQYEVLYFIKDLNEQIWQYLSDKEPMTVDVIMRNGQVYNFSL